MVCAQNLYFQNSIVKPPRHDNFTVPNGLAHELWLRIVAKLFCCFRQIYYRILYFDCFTCFHFLLKSKGNASLFIKLCLAKKMLAFIENMSDGRLCGCYILTISIEKQRKCPRFVLFLLFVGYGWAGADFTATRNWCCVGADGVYFYCSTLIVHGFAEGTTDTFCAFYFINKKIIKQAWCAHRIAALKTQTSRPRGATKSVAPGRMEKHW